MDEDSYGLPGFILSEMKKQKLSYLENLCASKEKTNYVENKTLEKNVEVIGQNLFGDPSTPKAVLIRQSYKDILPLVLSALNEPKGNVLIAGTRGIGKSVFGLFMVIHFAVVERKVVCYEHINRKLIVVGKNVDLAQFDALTQRMRVHGYENAIIEDCVVYNLTQHDSGLWDDLLTHPELIHVQDLGDNSQIMAGSDGAGRRLILSSPNSDRLFTLRDKLKDYLFLYLPVWTEDEIMVAARKIHKLEEKDEEDLRKRFKKFGGIPRMLFQERPEYAQGRDFGHATC